MEPDWINLPELPPDGDVEGDEGVDWDWEAVPNEDNTSFVGKRRRPRP